MRVSWGNISLVVLATAGCIEGGIIDPGVGPRAPRNLFYIVEPTGSGSGPQGILLRWDWDSDPSIDVWNVYARGTASGNFGYVGSTTSNSFHEDAIPALEYFVTAVDRSGNESDRSNIVVVDSRLALARPSGLSTVSLDGAVALYWPDNAFEGAPSRFLHYRIYSAAYDLDADLCGATWRLEGTTVAPEFRAGALANGVPRCFGVTAVSLEGFESLWSPIRHDTPRFDARNVLLTARQDASATSGFRFWRDLNGDGLAQRAELGLVGSGNAPDIDFSVERTGAGQLFLTPIRTGVTLRTWTNAPIGDLTEIDFAPSGGYSRLSLEARPGWGYVWETPGGTYPRYGAVRVTHVGQQFLILDWSFQSDPGNPELAPPGP